MEMKSQLLIFVVVVLAGSAFADLCPASEDIMPCTCKNEKTDAYVTCEGLSNAQGLMGPMDALKGKKIYSLEIKNSNLGDIPGSTFKGNHFEVLKFSYSKMTSIGDDKDPAFAGLEGSLKTLYVIEGFWDYDKPLTDAIKVGHLSKLSYIHSENNIIPHFGNEWYEEGPFTLKHLHIENSLIKTMGSEAFKPLTELRTLHLTGNAVTPQRSMLPDNPQHLESLDFSENEITEVPPDMFTKCPSLSTVSLDGNAIQNVLEGTFKDILTRLDFLTISSNPLNCGPKMKWIFENNLQHKVFGECASPENLRGKSIDELTTLDISD